MWSSDSQDLRFLNVSTECLGRAKPSLPLMDARGARIGWYLSRPAARVQKAKGVRTLVRLVGKTQTGTGRRACA